MLLTMINAKRLQAVEMVMDGRLKIGEAAKVLEIGERQVWRLVARVRKRGPEGIVHGNRGRATWNQKSAEEVAKIVRLLREK